MRFVDFAVVVLDSKVAGYETMLDNISLMLNIFEVLLECCELA
jgi:hypothetical protein